MALRDYRPATAFRSSIDRTVDEPMPGWLSKEGLGAGCRRDGAAVGRPGSLLLAALLACVLLMAGCASPRAYVAPRAAPGPLPCSVPVKQHEVVVGVAMSGGGSRAALFGAAGLEALAGVQTRNRQSLLEQVSYVSSVSGGSIAASYYALKKPPRNVPMLAPDGALSDAYRTFFNDYRNAVGQSIGPAVFRRQISRFRWVNPALAAVSLQEILSERLLGDASIMDLARREALGDSPGLIINTTLYNNGRRFALAGYPSEAYSYDFFLDLQRTLVDEGRPVQFSPNLLEGWQRLLPMTPHELHLNVCAIRLSAAVSGSASFPPAIGPITFRIDGDPTYWHAGDGGLYENQGLETLLFMFLKQLQVKQARRALIVAFDSSFPFAVGDIRLNHRAQPFGLLSFDFSRIPSIMEERATTFRTLFFRTLQLQGVFPDPHTIEILLLRHTDALWRPDLSDLPAACRNENPRLHTPAQVRQRLGEIPTKLRIVSECDRQLLVTSAAKVVAQKKQNILEFLDGPPPAPVQSSR
jgi:predicted acylesterase/phospholipase RssA